MLKTIRNFCILIFFILCLSSCGVIVRGIDRGFTNFSHSSIFHQGRYGKLTETELKYARIAWTYFENNYNPETGLVNSVDGYPSTTMWELADYLAALTAAREFDLIKQCDFDQRLAAVLGFLNNMDLAFNQMPNKVYNTQTAKMTDYGNQPGEVGWSAIDIGRLLIWLKIIENRYPVYSEYIGKGILRWNFCKIIDKDGYLYGAYKAGDSPKLYQEGRLGYEEYAAKGFQLWGFSTPMASKVEPYQEMNIYNTPVPYDSRNVTQGGEKSPVVSMGYFLHGLEMNWDRADDDSSSDASHTDPVIGDFADRIYTVQEARWKADKIFTARSDHAVVGDPYFVYDSIFAAGYPWNVISDDGRYHKQLSLVSTRTAFSMWSLWKTHYTDCLLKVVNCLHDETKGWFEGRLENNGGYMELITLSTNAVVLESLLYKAKGKLLDLTAPDCRQIPTYFGVSSWDEFKNQGKCLPGERELCNPL